MTSVDDQGALRGISRIAFTRCRDTKLPGANTSGRTLAALPTGRIRTDRDEHGDPVIGFATSRAEPVYAVVFTHLDPPRLGELRANFLHLAGPRHVECRGD